MADRYPLVVDITDSNKIKEIPNGDNLYLAGNSITGVVNVTASGVVNVGGDLNVTGTFNYQGNPLAPIATTGNYGSLVGAPVNISEFNNDENYLQPGQNISILSNDAGYLTSVAFADLTSTPTTLGGYGITDAASIAQGALAQSALQPGSQISSLNNDTGYVTLGDIQSGLVTVDVNNTGDLVGSVFADDSTVMIDSVLGAVNLNGTIRGHVLPNANQSETWDIGSDTQRFRHVHAKMLLGDANQQYFVKIRCDDGYTGPDPEPLALGSAKGIDFYLDSDANDGESAFRIWDNLNPTVGTPPTDDNWIFKLNSGTGNLGITGGFTGIAFRTQFSELTGATGVVDHDCSTGQNFRHTTPAADWTVNLTNFYLGEDAVTTVELKITQGGTGYIPTALQIAGVAQSFQWLGGSQPTAGTNGTDIVEFKIYKLSGSLEVTAKLESYS